MTVVESTEAPISSRKYGVEHRLRRPGDRERRKRPKVVQVELVVLHRLELERERRKAIRTERMDSVDSRQVEEAVDGSEVASEELNNRLEEGEGVVSNNHPVHSRVARISS